MIYHSAKFHSSICILTSWYWHVQAQNRLYKDELWSYKRIPTVHFRTDHGLIELLTPIETHIHHISIIGQEKRYAFSLLKDPVMRSVIGYEWSKVQPLLTELIGKIRYKMQMGCITSYNSAIEVVNIAYESIIGAILNLCEKNFPQYDPEAIKSKRDASQDLNNCLYLAV